MNGWPFFPDHMNLRFILILQLSLIFLSCENKDATPDVVAPTNLVVDVEVDDNQSGLVTVTANATGSIYYEFEFGENQFQTPVKDTDGEVQFTYAASGTYTILIRAHANAEVFIQTTITAQVVVAKFPATGYSTPETYAGYNLVWRDEFDGDVLNSDYWTHEIGTGSNGWGNNELQYYRAQNTTIEEGHLVIEARKENFGGRNYTSSRIITKDKKSFKYGRVDIRAAMPKGQGIWPALWMLGSNFSTVGWPKCGEIDIMEMIGGAGKDNTVHGTVHWDNNGSYAGYGKSYTLSSGILADKWHVFSIIWNENSITWYIDDIQYNVIDITPAGLSEFREEFFFIFNVAVGGNWPGSPDGTTVFPQCMAVDFIRVFQLQ
jgi:beta-glucanase (GH16 family)